MYGVQSGTAMTVVGVIILIICSGSQTVYFSPKAGGLDCSHQPCKARNPEQVKKEFLADPFSAVAFFPTKKTGEIRLVYLADIESAISLSDTIDILQGGGSYPSYGVWQLEHLIKMLDTKTLDWQRLSTDEKIKYLHDFAKEIKNTRTQ